MIRTLATVVLILCCSLASAKAPLQQKGSYKVTQWEISRDEAVRLYFLTPDFTPLMFDTAKEYDNRIYSHLISVFPDVAERTEIIRSNAQPQRDMLFIGGRLFSLVERHPGIDQLQFKMIFVSMKAAYGLPSLTKENDYAIYTYKTDTTHAILVSRSIGDKYEVKIYLYSQTLFRRMFMEQ